MPPAGLDQVTDIATTYAFTAWNFASDFLIVLILFVLFFVFAWYVGRGAFVSLLLSFYGGYAIYSVFPYKAMLPDSTALTALLAEVGVYLAFTLVFFFIIKRLIVSDFLYIGGFGLFILALLAAGFIMSLAYHVFPVSLVYQFTPALDLLFAPAQYFFWWFSAPVIGLLFLAR
jgi:hypothetical protein